MHKSTSAFGTGPFCESLFKIGTTMFHSLLKNPNHGPCRFLAPQSREAQEEGCLAYLATGHASEIAG